VNRQDGSVEPLTTDSPEGTEVQFLRWVQKIESQCSRAIAMRIRHMCQYGYQAHLVRHSLDWPCSTRTFFLKSFTKETLFVKTLHDLDVYAADPAAEIPTCLRVWIEPGGVDISHKEDEEWSAMHVHNVSWVVKIHPEETFRTLQAWARHYATDTMPHLIKGDASHPYSQLYRAALGQALASFIHTHGGQLQYDTMRIVQKQWADSLRTRLDEAAKPTKIQGVQKAVHVIEAQGVRMILTPTEKAYKKVEDEIVEVPLINMLTTYGADDSAVTKTISTTFSGGISFPSTPLVSASPAPPPGGLCPTCGGTGATVGTCPWTGQPVTENCPSCGGTGHAK